MTSELMHTHATKSSIDTIMSLSAIHALVQQMDQERLQLEGKAKGIAKQTGIPWQVCGYLGNNMYSRLLTLDEGQIKSNICCRWFSSTSTAMAFTNG